MISLDQIQILEKKIESAVAKIAQLTAENDALRSKCAELTNALSAKTEQLSAFQTDQNKIELGIRKALEQLENISETSTGSFQVEPEEKTSYSQPDAEQSNTFQSEWNTGTAVASEPQQSSEPEAAWQNEESADETAEDSAENSIEEAESNYSDSDNAETNPENYDIEEESSYSEDETIDGQIDSETQPDSESAAAETSGNDSDYEEKREQILSDRDISLIFSLHERGLSVTDIASTLKKPEAEVEAVIAKQKTEQENDGDIAQTDTKPIFDIF